MFLLFVLCITSVYGDIYTNSLVSMQCRQKWNYFGRKTIVHSDPSKININQMDIVPCTCFNICLIENFHKISDSSIKNELLSYVKNLPGGTIEIVLNQCLNEKEFVSKLKEMYEMYHSYVRTNNNNNLVKSIWKRGISDYIEQKSKSQLVQRVRNFLQNQAKPLVIKTREFMIHGGIEKLIEGDWLSFLQAIWRTYMQQSSQTNTSSFKNEKSTN